MKTRQRILSSIFAAAMFMVMGAAAFAADLHVSSPFQGPKANKGTVSHSMKNGKSMLTLSDDFVVPDTPDPHWQLVDSNDQVYLLDKLKLKGDREKREIEVRQEIQDKTREFYKKLNDDAREKLMSVLTSAQRQKLKDLEGDKFELKPFAWL